MTVSARIRSVALVGVVCAGLAATLTGCGGTTDPHVGTNKIGKLPAAKIEAKARRAAESAESVRLSGKVLSAGRTYRLDMRLSTEGGVGEVSTEDSAFELLRIGEELYLKADTDFWLHQGGDATGDGRRSGSDAKAAAGKLRGKYVKVPVEDPAYQQLSGFTTMDVMLDGMLVLQGKRKIGKWTQVRGRRAIQVLAGAGRGGLIDVSLVGRPYPLRLERAGRAGVLHMTDWNEEFALRAPRRQQIVDYGEQVLRRT